MLTLTSQQLQAIQTHAEQAYPQECCGLLLGHSQVDDPGRHNHVHQIYAAANTWEVDKYEFAPDQVQTPATRRYWISPVELLKAQQYARSLGCDIIGVYHSHPDHAAVPSECDRTWAWPHYSYIIVAVYQGQAQETQSWMLNPHQQFQPDPIVISDAVPS